ncbi:histidine phosphatase family protein [Streptomyces cinerochromogenes]|uniref:histidine phosphatase family protein n=1 Tax=Streptomyces cinerochromogenes TaxID=66422 RepID=UPI00166FABD6|nr:histidine phosphatase family protein [Streptomyces cinerochromogenes]GGS75697.1 phosphoglycerate mutase [Streptomyces cinerochromogenes]
MTVRLTMLCATPADSGPDRVFGDGALTERRRRELAAVRTTLPPYPPALRGPSVRCAQTATALGIEALPEHALRDLDHGTWDGRSVQDVAAGDPHGLSVWLTDPDAAPHGGESVRALCRRTAAWLDALPPDADPVLTITEASVIRAALVHALSLPARAYRHLEVPPSSVVTLTRHEGLWSTRLGRLTVPQRRQPSDGPAAVAVLSLPTTRRPAIA